MKSQLVSDTADAQVHVVILDSGEEALAALTLPEDRGRRAVRSAERGR